MTSSASDPFGITTLPAALVTSSATSAGNAWRSWAVLESMFSLVSTEISVPAGNNRCAAVRSRMRCARFRSGRASRGATELDGLDFRSSVTVNRGTFSKRDGTNGCAHESSAVRAAVSQQQGICCTKKTAKNYHAYVQPECLPHIGLRESHSLMLVSSSRLPNDDPNWNQNGQAPSNSVPVWCMPSTEYRDASPSGRMFP